MKKIILCLLTVCALCLTASALAKLSEVKVSEAVTVTFTTEQGDSISVNQDAMEIDLGNMVLSRQGNDFNNLVSFINQLPYLMKLDMYNTEVYAAQVEMLAAACPQVEFGWTMVIPCDNPLHPERTPHKVRTDQTAFSTLHNSQCSMHTTGDLQILRFCRYLKALDIGHNAVDNLDFLYEMPQLKVLILGKNNITDITPLSSLKELEYLELFSNKVSNVTPLAGCVSLVDLNLANNSIGDFSPLKSLTNLRRLFIYNSAIGSNNGPISNAIVGELHAALPACRIDNVTGGAHSAWREHHRYNTLLEMFWEKENIPSKNPSYVPFKNLD
ncbi:MAG: leucine-rich repeat domain-containing protein [Clostridia bacterium]|nr:leucine-rich repeat domain-containing protein [Clostridia bacterium]